MPGGAGVITWLPPAAPRRLERWTDEEDAVLRAAPPGTSHRVLAIRLGRTTQAVKMRVRLLRRRRRLEERTGA